MKYIFSEFQAEYEKYNFPYQVYLLREEGDFLESIYNLGFLPTRIDPDLFYLSRGVRVDLSKFSISSENRRILRKVEPLQVKIETTKSFNYDYTIGKAAKEFYDSRFGSGTLSAQKVKWIFTSGVYSHVYVYTVSEDSDPVGYSIVNQPGNIAHYAYPFQVGEQASDIGLGMMLLAIIQAQSDGLKYFYLGTAYTESSKYKLQFEGVEFFNGWEWSSDIAELKRRISENQVGHIMGESDLRTEIINQIKSHGQ